MTTKEIEGTSKTDPGPRARFEKHIAQYSAIQHLGNSQTMGIRFHAVSNLKDQVDIVSFKLPDADNMGAAKFHTLLLLHSISTH